ncbi:helix-turn-helix domain-containing protein [Thauera propionica]|uniref:helix-turn-helix domain-containing protein n=1 Tax=Thauera propionica TaxID=2019431 RepID=UPI001F0B0841|nr:XRE family transcriptional regulator [Thauera propionica]
MTNAKRSEPNATPKKRLTLRFKTAEDVKECRKTLGLNQSQFWSPLGVTQSGGSRYESGRSIPKAVQMLLHMAYGTEKQAQDLLGELRSEKG